MLCARSCPLLSPTLRCVAQKNSEEKDLVPPVKAGGAAALRTWTVLQTAGVGAVAWSCLPTEGLMRDELALAVFTYLLQ